MTTNLQPTFRILKSLIFVSLLTCLAAPKAYSQFGNRYKEYHNEAGIVIYGKWKYAKPFKQGPLILCLKVENSSGETRSVSFDVNYYNIATVSEVIEFRDLCLKPGQKLKGRKHGLCLQSEEFTNEELFSEDFHWKIESLKAPPQNDCDSSSDQNE
ncbi:MAG: hypothetical protein Kow0075_15390 [Salibacteraceae bacterium]